MKEYRSIKLWLGTYRVLKVLAAQNGETLAALIDRLAENETRRVRGTKDAAQSKPSIPETGDI